MAALGNDEAEPDAGKPQRPLVPESALQGKKDVAVPKLARADFSQGLFAGRDGHWAKARSHR
eukprot:1843289-Pyramimonas_sp.AAC.1